MYYDPYAPRPAQPVESEDERRRRENVWAPLPVAPPAAPVDESQSTVDPLLMNAVTQPQRRQAQQGEGIDWARLIALFGGR
jgi:hypothetical protein